MARDLDPIEEIFSFTDKDLEVTDFNVADYIDDERDAVGFLNAIIETGRPELLQAALGDIARSRGMTELSRKTGVTRDGLYKALGETGNPSYDLVRRVLEAFGLRLQVVPIDSGDAQSA